MGRILVFVFVRRWGPILGQSPPINEFLAAKKGPKSGARTGPIPIPEGIPQCQRGASWGAQPPLPGPTSAGAHFARRPARTVAAIATTVAAIVMVMMVTCAMHRRGTPAGPGPGGLGTQGLGRAGPGYTLCYTILFRGRNLGLPGKVSPGLKKNINPGQSSATCVFRTKPKGPLFIIFGSRALLSSIFGVDTVIFLFRALQRRWVAKLPTWAEGVWGGK